MNSAEIWAQAVWADMKTKLLFSEGPQAVFDREPAIVAQRLTRNVLLCGGPTEFFSKSMPVWNSPSPTQDDLLPIDILYGVYHPTDRSIEIFVNRIRQDAPIFGAEPAELTEIVRIHEFAHAVVHLGVSADHIYDDLQKFGGGTTTAWPEFLVERTAWFARTTEDLHEFLAQAITYSALACFTNDQKCDKRLNIFEALEAKQPARYKLPRRVKNAALAADWPLVLNAARGLIDAEREEGFELIAGITALICRDIEPKHAPDAKMAAVDGGVSEKLLPTT